MINEKNVFQICQNEGISFKYNQILIIFVIERDYKFVDFISQICITKQIYFDKIKIQKIMKPEIIKNPKFPPQLLKALEASKENRLCTNISTARQIYLTPEKPMPPTDFCRIKHQSKALKSSQCYFLNSNLLQFCDIAPHVRERMITWLMEQTSKRYLHRQTFALTISLMDLYLMKKGQITIQKIQQLGIACLNLACKYNQSFIRPIQTNPNLFSQQSIYFLQLQVLKKFNYKLNPPNYATTAQFLISKWDVVAENYSSLKNIKLFCNQITDKFGQKQRKILLKIVRFYQLLDCCIAIKQILDYDLEDLVYNSFIVFIGGEEFLGALINEKFENQIKLAVKQIFQLSSEFQKQPLILDISLQKLIQIPYELLKQNQKSSPLSFLPLMNPAFAQSQNLPHLSLKYLHMIQTFQPYCLKIIKQSATQIKRLQQSFQVSAQE